MSTFIDKFFSMRQRIPENVGSKTAPIYAQIREAMAQAECIVAHNVSEYFYTSPTEYWQFPEDFPAVVPPFRCCLVECGRPSSVWSQEKGSTPEVRDMLPKSWGVLFQTTRFNEFMGKSEEDCYRLLGWRYDELKEHLSKFIKGAVDNKTEGTVEVHLQVHDKSPLVKDLGFQKHGDIRTFNITDLWFVTATLFTELPNGYVGPATDSDDGIMGPLCSYSFLVDKYGYVMGEPIFSIPTTKSWYMSLGMTEPERRGHLHRMVKNLQENVSVTLFFPAFLAVSFMHCKNVNMKTERPPEKLNKKRVKKGNRPLVTYRTLEIEPMKKVLHHEGQAEKTGIPQALHITRGHFKDYRGSEKGLFGRYKGLWWWDQHLAGKAEAGTIIKDYVEMAPGEDANPLEEK